MERDVPYVKQPLGSSTCGPACATMVLKYFGHRTSYKRVAQELFVGGKGIVPSRLGSYFLTKDLDVTVQCWPTGTKPALETPERLGGDAALKLLDRAAKTGGTNKARKFPKEISPLIRRGGTLILKPIDQEDLCTALYAESLIVSLVDLKIWGAPRKTGHFNLIYGINENLFSKATEPHVYVHDPDIGKELRVPIPRMLEACNAMVGAMLYIKKPA
ncbi:MAG: Peptidase like family [Candidatus Parcubacteria bacterium]|jgi:hypothetical protein